MSCNSIVLQLLVPTNYTEHRIQVSWPINPQSKPSFIMKPYVPPWHSMLFAYKPVILACIKTQITTTAHPCKKQANKLKLKTGQLLSNHAAAETDRNVRRFDRKGLHQLYVQVLSLSSTTCKCAPYRTCAQGASHNKATVHCQVLSGYSPLGHKASQCQCVSSGQKLHIYTS